MSQAQANPPAPLSFNEAVESQSSKDIDKSQAFSVEIDKIRGNLARRLIGLIIGVNIGIGVLLALDLIASKLLVIKTIEYVATQSSQATKSSDVGTTNKSSPDSSSSPRHAEIAVVYKDLLKESALNKDLLTLLLTSQTALVSGALGFYFGGKDNSK